MCCLDTNSISILAVELYFLFRIRYSPVEHDLALHRS